MRRSRSLFHGLVLDIRPAFRLCAIAFATGGLPGFSAHLLYYMDFEKYIMSIPGCKSITSFYVASSAVLALLRT